MRHLNRFICTLIVLAGSFSSCKTPPFDHAYRIKIQNNSTKLIGYLASYNYPDTTIPDQQDQLSGVSPNDYTPKDSKEDWGSVLGRAPGKKISIFFFSPDTITKYGWQTVRSNYNILARKDFSIQNLDTSHYTITYP